MEKKCVLVVENRADLCRAMISTLREAGFKVRRADEDQKLVDAIEAAKVELAIIGSRSSRVASARLCLRIRAAGYSHQRLAIMVIGGRQVTSEVADVLDAGADDFLAEPFDMAVFLARVRSLLRRAPPVTGKETKVLHWGPFTLDPARSLLTRGRNKVLLTRSQFMLVYGLVREDGRVLSRRRLIEIMQGEGVSVTPRTVDLHVLKARRQLGAHASIIETVRGFGYRAKKPV